DGRHPVEVTFTPCLSEDLLRRDFTINAMAYNETDGLVDLFGGLEDIARKQIRCVGNPRERFTEDALRLLRAIRFSAQLGYEIDAATEGAIREIAPNLQKISAERIQTELVKILLSDHPKRLERAYELGLTKYFIPELDLAYETGQNNPHHCYNVGEHMINSIGYAPKDKVLRLTMLFHDIGKPLCKTTDSEGIDHFYDHPLKSAEMAKQILRRLKFDNDTIAKVSKLISYHDERIESGIRPMRRAVARIGEDIFPELFEVFEADLSAQSDYLREKKFAKLGENRRDYEELIRLGQCVSKETLAVDGKDLIQMGMRPGPEIGKVLKKLLEYVVENPELNEKNILLSYAKKMVKEIE
ncbi:MAG: HD domain-containing protein, partial [Lachnospiraceae bacterium]|nr:HD domain-containing protein [Lachnospiraceae bacterium]